MTEEFMLRIQRSILLLICLSVLFAAFVERRENNWRVYYLVCMKKVFLVFLLFLFVTISCAQQNASDCSKRVDFLNDEEVDLYASSFVGQVKEIKILEKNLESDSPQEITTTIKFDEKGKITETFLSNARIKMFGRTLYSYDNQNRIIKKTTYNPDGSAVTENVFTYNTNGGLESKATQNAITKKVIMKTGYKYESPESYSQYYDGRFARWIKLTKDEKCRIVESNLYKEDKSLENKITISYDDKNNIVESIVFSPNGNQIEKMKYQYEYDSNGNWIKQNIYEWTFRDGNAPYKLTRTKQRTIVYSNSK